MPQSYQDDLSFRYFARDLENYSWHSLKSDFIAGCVVAAMTIPQALAYSFVAGLPLSAGFFSAIYIALIVAIIGSSRHLLTGPSNAIAILIQACLAELAITYFPQVHGLSREGLILGVLTQLALLVGIIQIAAALFRLGKVTQFFSHSVIVGYMGGVALALAINQMFPLLGMAVPPDRTSLYERSTYILSHLQNAHLPTALLGLLCWAFLILLRRWKPHLPGSALLLCTIALPAYALHLLREQIENTSAAGWLHPLFAPFSEIAVIGQTAGETLFPQLHTPYFDTSLMNTLLPVAFAIAILSIMEATSTAKAIASNSGQRLSTNQEILGLGIGNLFGAMIGAMPPSGSPSRSTFSYESGAKTRMAAIFHSLFVLALLWAFSFLIGCLPITAFAALLIASSINIVNFKQVLLCLKATRADRLVLIMTFASCVFLSLDIAFYIGVVMSIALHLQKAAVPELLEFSIDANGILLPIARSQQDTARPIRFIKVEGELFFGAADLFQNALKAVTEDDKTTRVLILQFKNARDIDATACLVLQQLFHYLHRSGRHLICCGIPYAIWDVLSDAGLIEVLGKENLFIFDEKHPHLSTQRAIERATLLLSVPLPSHTQDAALPPFALELSENTGTM